MNAIVTINQPESPAQILAAALKLAPNYSTTHALTIAETSTAPFVFDDESGVCLDRHGNLCINMVVKGTEIGVYFKTASHGEIELQDQEVTPALEPWNDHYHDISYYAHTVERDALCVVVQANDMWLPEGTLFRLTEAQAWRINESLAAYNVDVTNVVPHA
ncbi:MAG: hypothetical protein WA154_13110 [Moraxellaceae bacterium]